jgi:rhamnosyltransferase
MTAGLSVASVTIAYNGASTLPRQLDALRNQTRKLDEIVVVNNASTDNVLSLLASHYPDVTVLDLPENRGVGGGYSAGLSYTLEKYDWTWFLDGDSVPSLDALENLLEGIRDLGDEAVDVAIVAPVCVNSQTGGIYPGLMWQKGWRYTDDFALTHPAVFVDSVISSGSLLSSAAARQVGYPRSDYFIDFVDHEYCFRLRRSGYRIAMITRCRMAHTIGQPRRIHFLGLSKQWVDHPVWREYYMARNAFFTIWQYYPDWRSKLAIVRQLVRHLIEIGLFGTRKLARLRMIVQGLRDAFAGTLGVRYLPARKPEAGVEAEFVAQASENL